MPFEPKDKRISTFRKRSLFLDCVKEYSPELLYNLRDELFAAFQRVASMIDSTIERNQLKEFTKKDLLVFDDDQKYIADFLHQLRNWCQNSNVDAKWFRRTAFQSLCVWNESNMQLESLNWYKGGSRYWLPPGSRGANIHFSFRGWYSTGEARTEYADLVREKFREYLQKYLDDIEKSMLESEWITEPKTANEEHCIWFVLFQVKGLSLPKVVEEYKRISGKTGISEDALRKGIRRFSEDIGIERRTIRIRE